MCLTECFRVSGKIEISQKFALWPILQVAPVSESGRGRSSLVCVLLFISERANQCPFPGGYWDQLVSFIGFACTGKPCNTGIFDQVSSDIRFILRRSFILPYAASAKWNFVQWEPYFSVDIFTIEAVFFYDILLSELKGNLLRKGWSRETNTCVHIKIVRPCSQQRC